MNWSQLLDVVASAVPLAFLYALVGLGWVVIFRTTGVLNFATGELLLVGAFCAYSAQVTFGLPFVVAVVVSVAVVAALGVASYTFLLRPIAGQPAFVQIIMTLGLSIVLSGAIPMVWGVTPVRIPAPVRNERFIELPGGAFFTTYGFATIIAGAVLFGGIILFLRKIRMGTRMEAAAERPLLASQTGLNINRLFSVGWAMALVPAAIGGVSAGLASTVSPTLAFLGLRALAPAIIGGLDSVIGVGIGAIVVALVESLSVTYIGADSQNAAVFALLLVVLIVRPYGILGRAEVRRV